VTDKPNHPRPRVLSGIRPTGKPHLGNYVGALQNWVKLQDTHDCFFFIADWHALTTDYDETSRLAGNTLDVVLDYLAAGLDPDKCTIFVQSHVLQHAELHVLFSMITPLGWLERVPSYKEQQQQMPNKDLHMYGFLGYPLLQAADILIYRADFVPVGEDQAAHVELTREVARRFNQSYAKKGKPIFPEPQVLLTRSPKLLGMDKRKMSKSYGNDILLSDDAAKVEEKIKNSVTDRPKLSDKGSPDRCPVGNLHQIFSDQERLAYITRGCTTATITCVECKALATQSLNTHLDPIRERRRQLAEHPERLQEIIQEGAQKAAQSAEETMVAAREAVGLLALSSQSTSETTTAAEETVIAESETVGSQPKLMQSTSEKSALAHPLFVVQGVPQDADFVPLRVPDSISSAQSEEEERQIRIDVWLERVSQNYLLRKDRPQIFITRRGRKVGVDATAGRDGTWTFRFQDRPVNVLVLIAQDNDRILHDYVLPPKIVEAYWKQFERKDKIVEIKVGRSADRAWLALVGGDVPIQVYAGAHVALE
jgi:tryptophanyl-tRNA synthetase